MEVLPEKVKQIVSCKCFLHNFLLTRSRSKGVYASPGTFDREEFDDIIKGNWRQERLPNNTLQPMQPDPAEIP